MTKHLLIAALVVVPAVVSGQQDPAAMVKEGQKLEFAGKRAEAVERYREALKVNPKQFDAYIGLGRVAVVEGKGAEGRKHLQQALELAPENGINPALSSTAVAWMYEGNVGEAAAAYQKVFDRQMQAGARDAAAGTANALGRAYLESGDLDNAEKWYRQGYETAQKIDKLTPEQSDLWAMRWYHAQGRIAARRKNAAEAKKQVEAVKALADKGTLDEFQRGQLTYLEGYVAFYEGRYDDAIAALGKADQNDPFILSMIAQSYEGKKDTAKARELYQKIVDAPGYSLQAAIARRVAQGKLAAR
jgi:tetratricopeptide (TPR) repeat protein